MPEEIMLADIMNIPELGNTKVRFNLNNESREEGNGVNEPIEVWLKDHDVVNTQWLFWRYANKLFKVGEVVLCLVRLGKKDEEDKKDLWLLTTVKKVTKDLDVEDGINYEGEEVSAYAKYFGRLVLRYHKSKQTSVWNAETIWDDLVVDRILPAEYNGHLS